MWSSFELFKARPLKMAPYSTLWENIANVSFHWLHSTLKHLCGVFLLYKRKTRWLPLLDIVLTEDKWENITQKLLHWWNLNSTLMIICWSFKKFVFLCWLEKNQNGLHHKGLLTKFPTTGETQSVHEWSFSEIESN